ncbi:MAG TPA: hypothetical protein VD866_27215 [Urbifossiella sp.]|nr:hypothetical protein [Urbifossiella sp.]
MYLIDPKGAKVLGRLTPGPSAVIPMPPLPAPTPLAIPAMR